MDPDEDFERTLTMLPEVFVYKIPPRVSAGGYRAKEWGEKEQWCGKLRVVQIGQKCFIRLIDRKTGGVFVECPYSVNAKGDGKGVESTVDSSRYFVLRVVDAKSGRGANIGIGFQERAASFDFNIALGDFRKDIEQQNAVAVKSTVPSVDYSLKQGQKISINIPGGSGRRQKNTGGGGGGGGGFLAPPPGAGGGGRARPNQLAPPPSSQPQQSFAAFGSPAPAPAPQHQQQQQQQPSFAAFGAPSPAPAPAPQQQSFAAFGAPPASAPAPQESLFDFSANAAPAPSNAPPPAPLLDPFASFGSVTPTSTPAPAPAPNDPFGMMSSAPMGGQGGFQQQQAFQPNAFQSQPQSFSTPGFQPPQQQIQPSGQGSDPFGSIDPFGTSSSGGGGGSLF